MSDLADRILPVSARAAGLRDDTRLGRGLKPYALASIQAPTLVISARDDGFGTYAPAEYTASQIAGAEFLGFDRSGHLQVGHDESIQQQPAAFDRDPLQSTLELGAAVTALAEQGVARQTFRVHARQHRLAVCQVTQRQGQVLLAAVRVNKSVQLKCGPGPWLVAYAAGTSAQLHANVG